MTSSTEAAESREPQGRWNGPSNTWFLFMVGSWIGFGVAATWYPEALTDFWEWGQGLPLVAEIGLWIATLPWMLALAVYETAWAGWVQVSFIVALALSWIVFSRPRAPKTSSPSPRQDTRQKTASTRSEVGNVVDEAVRARHRRRLVWRAQRLAR